MKLSTRSRYGTRLMLELALNYNKGPVLLKDISKSQEISLKYLAQIIMPLKIAGLIKSSRGAHGGYFLSKHPKDIKLSEIIVAVEGPLNLVECVDNPAICNRSDFCTTKDIWTEISIKLLTILESYTLQMMIRRYKIKNKFL
ncbi:MAG: Rrf2 family transcriptional regulator [Actinobacteria bacterium]|nr:Rrf2 family transcriptional regulator [Actinomycetota bacterium]